MRLAVVGAGRVWCVRGALVEQLSSQLAGYGVEGVVEGIRDGAVLGWARRTDDNREPCVVDVVGPGVFARCVANVFRPDLEAAGKRGGHCAFSARIGPEAERLELGELLVTVAGFPHRIRVAGGGTVEPIPDWIETSGDVLAQDLVVHRCHHALTGEAAPPPLLALARPRLPLGATSACMAMEAVAGQVARRPERSDADLNARLVTEVYAGVLRREVGTHELAMRCEALAAGLSGRDVIAELVASPEFLAAARLQPVAQAGQGGPEDMRRLAETLERALLTLAAASVRESLPVSMAPAPPRAAPGRKRAGA